jgi:hypothetical protein
MPGLNESNCTGKTKNDRERHPRSKELGRDSPPTTPDKRGVKIGASLIFAVDTALEIGTDPTGVLGEQAGQSLGGASEPASHMALEYCAFQKLVESLAYQKNCVVLLLKVLKLILPFTQPIMLHITPTKLI